METEERIKLLQDEFTALKEALQPVLIDIRTFIMEATNPLHMREQPTSEESAEQTPEKKEEQENA